MRHSLLIAFLISGLAPAIVLSEERFFGGAPVSCRCFGIISDGDFKRTRNCFLAKHLIKNIATVYQSRKLKDSEALQWAIHSIDLKTIENGQCYWIVEFQQEPRPGVMLSGIAPSLRIAVLMDGTIVEPKHTVKSDLP